MENLKKYAYIALGLALVIWSFVMVLKQPAPEKYQSAPVLQIGNHSINLEVADTDAERSLGLSGRTSLESDTGLLFIFEEPGIYSFWMKDMRFPIDIVWIDENWEVVDINRGVRPETYPELFHPVAPVKYVLELNSGTAVELGIDTNSKLFLIR
jgi:uncharacterized protein